MPIPFIIGGVAAAAAATAYSSEEELDWDITSSDQLKIFKIHIKAIKEVLSSEFNNKYIFNILVMLHAQTVAALELFLSSTFIHKVTNSDQLIKKLIESDPTFAKRKLTFQQIFDEQDNLKRTVADYLKGLIFHKIHIVKPMYKDVLGIDFGDKEEIEWLFKAIEIRHHCSHRAGYDHDGNKVDISKESIIKLVAKSENLAKDISNFLKVSS